MANGWLRSLRDLESERLVPETHPGLAEKGNFEDDRSEDRRIDVRTRKAVAELIVVRDRLDERFWIEADELCGLLAQFDEQRSQGGRWRREAVS